MRFFRSPGFSDGSSPGFLWPGSPGSPLHCLFGFNKKTIPLVLIFVYVGFILWAVAYAIFIGIRGDLFKNISDCEFRIL